MKQAVIVVVFIAVFAFCGYKAIQEKKSHSIICLDDRYWVCTETRMVAIGMAMTRECIKWERKP